VRDEAAVHGDDLTVDVLAGPCEEDDGVGDVGGPAGLPYRAGSMTSARTAVVKP
jgi:hypothetical protein